MVHTFSTTVNKKLIGGKQEKLIKECLELTLNLFSDRTDVFHDLGGFCLHVFLQPAFQDDMLTTENVNDFTLLVRERSLEKQGQFV